MESQFYSRATGKLSKSTYGTITEIKKSKRDGSTIYSIDDEEDQSQYPLGTLSKTQLEYIQRFVRALSGNDRIEIDPSTIGIHWIGMWDVPNDNVTISCSFLQPRVINCVVSPKGSSYQAAKRHSEEYFVKQNKGSPNIMSGQTSFQLLGKYSIPLMDSLIEHGIVKEKNVHWSNVIIGQTHPIFTIVSPQATYECSLTYSSCLVLDEASPNSVNISHPLTGTLNFTIRSSQVSQRDGEGGHMTVHGSGIIQCQGNPKYITETMACFRECIISVMKPKYISRFMSSLSVVRKID